MIQLTLNAVGINVDHITAQTPDGPITMKIITFIDPHSGIQITAPFDPEGQKAFEQAWHRITVVRPAANGPITP